MTMLRKPVRRVAGNSLHAGRALIVELRPGATETIFIREAGRRLGYSVPIAKVFALGARLEADAIRAEKTAKKKGRTK